MKIFAIPCTCEVCGGPGMARNYGWFQRHINPAVCAMYLEQRREELERREKVVREAESRMVPANQEGLPAPERATTVSG